MAWPVRSAAQQERCTGRSPKFCEWPPNGRWYTVPFSLRSNGMPKCSSSYTSLGASRRPAPPAPTTTASKLRLATATSDSPEDLHRPAGTACEPQDRRDLQREAQPGMLDVIHPDVAHADPGVDQDARDEKKGRKAHPPL